MDRETLLRALREHPCDLLPSGTPRMPAEQQRVIAQRQAMLEGGGGPARNAAASPVLDVIAVTPQRGFSSFDGLRTKTIVSTGHGAYVPTLAAGQQQQPYRFAYEEPLVLEQELRRAACNLKLNFAARRKQERKIPGQRAALLRHHNQQLLDETRDLLLNSNVPILGISASDAKNGVISAERAAELLSSRGRSSGGAESSGHLSARTRLLKQAGAPSPVPTSSPASARSATAAAAASPPSSARSSGKRSFKPATYQQMLDLSSIRTPRSARDEPATQRPSPLPPVTGGVSPAASSSTTASSPAARDRRLLAERKRFLLAAHQHDSLKNLVQRSNARAQANVAKTSQLHPRPAMTETPPVVAVIEHERTVEAPRRVAELLQNRHVALQVVAGHRTDEVDAQISALLERTRVDRAARELRERHEREERERLAFQRRVQRQMAARQRSEEGVPGEGGKSPATLSES